VVLRSITTNIIGATVDFSQALLTAAVDLRLGHLSPQSLSLITLLVNTETDCDQEMVCRHTN